MMSCRPGVCACRRQSCGRVRPDGTSLGRRLPHILDTRAREQNYDLMSFCLVASSRGERRCCLLSFTRRRRLLPAARTIGKVPERRRPHGHGHHQVPGPARARAPVRASRARAARPDLPRRSAGDGGDQVRGCPIPPPLSPRRARGCLARGLRLNASGAPLLTSDVGASMRTIPARSLAPARHHLTHRLCRLLVRRLSRRPLLMRCSPSVVLNISATPRRATVRRVPTRSAPPSQRRCARGSGAWSCGTRRAASPPRCRPGCTTRSPTSPCGGRVSSRRCSSSTGDRSGVARRSFCNPFPIGDPPLRSLCSHSRTRPHSRPPSRFRSRTRSCSHSQLRSRSRPLTLECSL